MGNFYRKKISALLFLILPALVMPLLGCVALILFDSLAVMLVCTAFGFYAFMCSVCYVDRLSRERCKIKAD